MIAKQQKQIEVLTAGLQRVSAQLELNKSAPQTVLKISSKRLVKDWEIIADNLTMPDGA